MDTHIEIQYFNFSLGLGQLDMNYSDMYSFRVIFLKTGYLPWTLPTLSFFLLTGM